MSVQSNQNPTYADIFQDFTKNNLTQTNLFHMVYKKCIELESTVKTLQDQITELNEKQQPAKAGGGK
jgi:hypothetical protein